MLLLAGNQLYDPFGQSVDDEVNKNDWKSGSGNHEFKVLNVWTFGCSHESRESCESLESRDSREWSFGHAAQLLFSCVSSKLIVCHDDKRYLRDSRGSHDSRVTEWSMGHAEQLLFSCVSSKVTVCHAITCHVSGPWDNNGTCWPTFVFLGKLKSDCLSSYHMSHVICKMLMLILGTCLTTFAFMSMLKSHCF